MQRILARAALLPLGLVALIFAFGGRAAWADELAGMWTLTLDTPRGVQHPTLMIVAHDGGYHGVLNGSRGEMPIPMIQGDAKGFSFPLTVSMPMGEMDLVYSGTVSGDTMQGEAGNPFGSIPFVGERAPSR